jgi:hypothetical protein
LWPTGRPGPAGLREASARSPRARDVEFICSSPDYAYADWSLERGAEAMTRGGFRHVIVLKSGDAVGILKMRDIVRCWLTEGATCDVTPQSATA